jgi:hypothetical protein
MADGLPDDLDAWIAALGNSVVPQIPEIIGRWIVQADKLMATDSYTTKQEER